MIDAFEQSDFNMDSISNNKEIYGDFIRELFFGSLSITSASANYQTAMHTKQKQTSEVRMSLTGGMSKVSPPIDLSAPF